ncbi:peroxisomal multifunctional enzyme A-like [Armigeres subalbatus]|uniref:peroxisomal multifunctional enzyme A-like n=1 Tax=Armigeres subalbatus TaxID=124917 RepID=UPI002ED30C1E
MSVETIIEKIKARLAAPHPNESRKVDGVFQLNIKTESGVEQFVLDLKQLTIDAGVSASPNASLTIALEDILAISGKTLTVGDALKNGKFEISGDTELATKLGEGLIGG